MSTEIEGGYARIITARRRLLDLRSERIEQLLRMRVYLRTLLADFLGNVDPLTGARMADLLAEGSKAAGDLSLTLVFFEGSKLRLLVDPRGRFSGEVEPQYLIAEHGTIVDVDVSEDHARAALVFAPPGSPQERRGVDVRDIVEALVHHAAGSVEGETEIARAPEAQAVAL